MEAEQVQLPINSSVEELVTVGPLAVADQALCIFLESPPLVAAMVDDIQRATKCVWLEFYIVQADSAGNAIANALVERAAAGVDVRVLYDGLGCQATPLAFFNRLTAAGVDVLAYNTIWDALRSVRRFTRIVNRRNHRKLLIVDDAIGYFGGMNITGGEADAAGGAGRPIPDTDSSGWRDVHVRLAGHQAVELADSFDRSWRRALRLRVQRRPRTYRRGRLPLGAEKIRFYDSGPGRRHSRAHRVYRRLFRRAQSRITISMAYFLPTGRVLGELLRAARRGVRIEVVVPSQSDVKLVERATRFMYPRLLRRCFVIYERQRRMLHSKIAVIDDEWSVVGSANLDARSLGFNLEFLAVVRSRRFASALRDVCDYEVAHSQLVTLEKCAASGRWEQYLNWCAYQLRWWL
ncbi:MAG: phosphatidylserine/phosphatidylglycerophosphate/cardiolipin synthase family protein [Pirellulales bacterium]|nr:phosphatidylserine/phosphatidylglycerophosphate/cardiolipin synthase family protein [Pirellulales bacterium]